MPLFHLVFFSIKWQQVILSFWMPSYICCLAGIHQIWEEALKHPSTHLPMLPCQRRRLCHHWSMQVCIQQYSSVSNPIIFHHLQNLMKYICFLFILQAIIKDSEVQCVEGNSSRLFWWCKESFYRHVRGLIHKRRDAARDSYTYRRSWLLCQPSD